MVERVERAAREFDGNGHNDHQLIRIRNGQCFSSPLLTRVATTAAAALTPLADSLVVGQCSVCVSGLVSGAVGSIDRVEYKL